MSKSNKLTTLLDQLQAEETTAQQQLVAKEKAHHCAMGQQADATLLHALGDYAEELAPLVYERGSGASHHGIAITWRLGSHDLQLTPTKIEWCERWPDDLSFTVEGANRNQAFHCSTVKISAESHAIVLPQVLLAMRTTYPAYKAKVDELNARQSADEANKRTALIANLCWPANWRHLRPIENIKAQYDQLVALGEQQLADEKLAAYRADVAAVAAREQKAAARNAAYEKALAEYGRQMARYNEACQQWAETEQARLWQPWTLWHVRYTPWHAQCSIEDVDRFPIEEICTLDAPEDIVTNANPIAHVEKVDWHGNVTEGFAIATFLDAQPIHYTTPPAIEEDEPSYHRCYRAGGYAAHVPPFILDEPAPAPVHPTAPRDDQDDQLPAIDIDRW